LTEPKRVNEFWQWIATNTQLLQTKKGMSEALIDELSERFDQAFPDLTWEIELQNEHDWWFVISADGIPGLIHAVVSAHETAPKIPGWKIVPFRQRGKLSVSIKLDTRKLTYDDIWCGVEPDGYYTDVTFYIHGFSANTDHDLKGATLILLDNAIGEFDRMVKIGSIEFKPLEGKPGRSETFFPLREMPDYLDNLPKPIH
jgi:hypothetical protein